MANLPKTTVAAVTTTITALLAPLAISQGNIDNGIKALIDAVSGKDTANREQPDTVLTAREVAERIHRSTKTVTALGKAGKIRAVYFGANGQRASGYSEKSVRDFIEGTEGKEVAT